MGAVDYVWQSRGFRVSVLVLVVAVLAVAGCHDPCAQRADGSREPLSLFLTWQRDPTTTMTIDWHAERGSSATLAYEDTEGTWHAVEAVALASPHRGESIFRVELVGLAPATSYRFRVGAFSRVYRFRTLPNRLGNESVVFAVGGDTRHSQEKMEQMNRLVMAHDPDFIVWGGDLAYCDGVHLDRWCEWFAAIKNTLIGNDGRVVPILVALGNHEVHRSFAHEHDDYAQTDEWRKKIAPFFYTWFAFPGQPGYGVLDVGDYLALLLLDSGHSNPVAGEQAAWLAERLGERTSVPYVFPVYHVAAYPSHRSYTGRIETEIRDHWVAQFDAHNVKVVFEHNDHTYKRTHPIREGAVAPDGITYVGDGAWGVSTRDGNSRNEWYIDRFAARRHAILVTLDATEANFLVVSDTGSTLDEFSIAPSDE